MVKTRAKARVISVSAERPNEAPDSLAEIRQKAEDLKDARFARQMDRKQSPRRRSEAIHKIKMKRNSSNLERMLSSAKKNLAKATDRHLENPPAQGESLFDQIHGPIISGEAKQQLKPVVIVIKD